MKRILVSFAVLALAGATAGCGGGKHSTGHDNDPGDSGGPGSDTAAPTLVSASAASHTSVVVVFSEAVEQGSAERVESYHIQGASDVVEVSVAALQTDRVTVVLAVGPTMVHAASYTLAVNAVADASGNAIDNATIGFLGRGAVVAELVGCPGTLTRNSDVSVTVSGVDIVAYQHQLDSGAWSAETDVATSVTALSLVEGSHALSVVGKDSLGNWQSFGEASHCEWTVDTAAPTAALSNTPANVTSATSADIGVGGTDVVAYKYQLDSGAWSDETPAGTPVSLSGLTEGGHAISVVGRDLAGNWQPDAQLTIYSWTIDLTAPVAELSSLPADPTNGTNISVSVAGAGVFLYQYKLDNGPWSADTTADIPISAGGLSEDAHTLYVVGADLAGNWQDQASATIYTWTIDLTAPVATLSNLPADPTNSTTTNIAVSGTGVVRYRFKLDAGPWSGRIDANTALTLSGLSEASHTLEFVGIDAAGNEDLLNPVSYTWTIDLSAPTAELVVNAPAASPTNSQAADIQVTGTDVVAYKYRLDSGAWSSETTLATSIAESALPEGHRTIEVIGRDIAGNWQDLGAATSFAWDIDLTAPSAVLNNLPNSVTNVTSTDIVVGGADVVAYQYKLDSGAWSAETLIASHIAESVADGWHDIYVIGRDAVGNWQLLADQTTYSWKADTSAATATLSGTPADPTNNTDASITVGGTDIVSYKYALDGAGWSIETDVATLISLSALPETTHTLQVIGKNVATTWQLEANATTYVWTVDLTAPAAQLSNTPPSLTNQTNASIAVGGTDVVLYRYRINSGGWSADTQVADLISLGPLGDGPYALEVVGRDTAGNWQLDADASSYSWTVDTLAPAPPAIDDLVGSVGGLGVYTNILQVTFSWTNPGDAAEIAIQVATDSGFTTIVFGGANGASVGTASSYGYIVDPANGPRYYARLKIRDAATNWSSFGASSDGIDVIGDVTGRVLDSNLNKVSGATVELRLMSDNSLTQTVTSDVANGDFTFSNVPIGTNFYKIEVSKAGFTNATKNNVTVTAGSTTNVGVIYLVSTGASPGMISGRVVDANDGSNIGGATITVRSWDGTLVDTQTSSTTNPVGTFTTSSLQPGTYSITISKLGYWDLTVDNVVVNGDKNIDRQALCEVLTEPHVRVVLLWGSSPQDLDLHVVGPSNKTVSDSDGLSSRFHVFWWNEGQGGQPRHRTFDENTGAYLLNADPTGTRSTTSLVQDDTNGYGPEAINLFGFGSGYAYGVYTFSVHKWSAGGTWYDFPITIRIYDSQGMAREIPIATGAGSNRYWKVFKIDIQGTTRSQRAITVSNTFDNLTYSSKASMDW